MSQTQGQRRGGWPAAGTPGDTPLAKKAMRQSTSSGPQAWLTSAYTPNLVDHVIGVFQVPADGAGNTTTNTGPYSERYSTSGPSGNETCKTSAAGVPDWHWSNGHKGCIPFPTNMCPGGPSGLPVSTQSPTLSGRPSSFPLFTYNGRIPTPAPNTTLLSTCQYPLSAFNSAAAITNWKNAGFSNFNFSGVSAKPEGAFDQSLNEVIYPHFCKQAGDRCPISSLTGKVMPSCSRMVSVDPDGVQMCRPWVQWALKNNPALLQTAQIAYCAAATQDAEDCACINGNVTNPATGQPLYPLYSAMLASTILTVNPACFWKPCAATTGNFLIPISQQPCTSKVGTLCQSVYNALNGGTGTQTFSGQTVVNNIQCTGGAAAPAAPPTPPPATGPTAPGSGHVGFMQVVWAWIETHMWQVIAMGLLLVLLIALIVVLLHRWSGRRASKRNMSISANSRVGMRT
jgi:hypothetical protein